MGRNKAAMEGQNADRPVRFVRHGPGARALRFGLGPDLRPARAIEQLQALMDSHAFWAQGRSLEDLNVMVRNSAICVTAWKGQRLVGFGRATSDGVYRGTIWDLVVDSEVGGQGIGRSLLHTLMGSKAMASCERVYLMTTNSAGFYEKMGFRVNPSQILMIKDKSG